METIQSLLDTVISTLQQFGTTIAIISFIAGAFQFFSKNPNKIENGKTTMLYAALGFLVIKFAPDIVEVLNSITSAS